MPGAALDRVSDGVVAFDTEWRFTYLNEAASRYYGRTREELIGRCVWDVFPAARGNDIAIALFDAARTLEPRELEARSTISQRMLQVRIYPAADGVTAYFLDVTSRHEAEQALRESEARYKSLFDHTMDGLVLADVDGAILDINPAGCELLGRTHEEVLAIGRDGVIDPHDPRLADIIAARARDGHVCGEVTMVRGDGTTFLAGISSSVFRDANHELRTSITFRDLTQHRRVLETLALLADVSRAVQSSLSSDEVLRQIATAVVPRLADLVVIDVVSRERIVRVVGRDHPGAETAISVLQASAPSKTTERGVSRVLRTREPEVVTEVDDAWLRLASQSEEHFRAAKLLAPISVLMVPMIARDRIVGVMSLTSFNPKHRYTATDLGLATGIAERAALAIDNAALYADAVAARMRRDEMLAIVSHDLHTPLNGIALNARLLQRRHASQPLDAILSSVHVAERLVNDLLAVSALESGGLALQRAPEQLATLVDEVIELHRAAAADREITLTGTAEPIMLSVDRHRVLQALSNLVANAIKFTPAGGTVQVVVKLEGTTSVIEVNDTGQGIPSDQLPRLFDRFWRGSRADRTEGVGLGLAIAKGIVEAHGGTIEVASVVGQGSRFSMRFPC